MQDQENKAQHDNEQLKHEILNIKQHRKKEFEQYETFRLTNKYKNNVNLHTMKQRRILQTESLVYDLSWSRDSSHLVSIARGGNLTFWRARENEKMGTILLERDSWAMCCCLSPSGRLVASGGTRLCVAVNIVKESLNKKIATPWRDMSGHLLYISSCEFVDDINLVTSSGDGMCILWDVEMGRAVHYFQKHKSDCMTVSVNPVDSNLFISGSCDKKVCLWDLRMHKCVKSFKAHSNDVNCVKFLQNGMGFASASEDLSCKVFDLRVDHPLLTFSKPELDEPAVSASFSKSGRILFSSHGPKIVAWDTLTGNLIREIATLDKRCSRLDVSPDGSALAVASWDQNVRVFA